MPVIHPPTSGAASVGLTRCRSQWMVMGSMMALLGFPALFGGVLVSTYGAVAFEPGILFLGVLIALAGFGPSSLARQCWRVATTTPALELTHDHLVVVDPGLLQEPLLIARSEVHSIYVGAFNDRSGRRPPWRGRRGWDAVRTFLRESDRWTVDTLATVVHPWGGLPNLSTHFTPESCNLLVVLKAPLDTQTHPRRGLDLINSLGRGLPGYNGPKRGWLIRGLLGRAEDPEAARVLLSTAFRTAVEPPPEILSAIARPNPGFRDAWRFLRRQPPTS